MSLTTHQRNVLEVPVDAGYYAAPRESSVRDLAAMLDLAPGTVSEPLRRAERIVFEALVDQVQRATISSQ